MIGVEFYHLDLDIKLKGYLIKLLIMALFEAHKMIVQSHIMAYNARRKHSGKIAEINRDNLNLLLQKGLDRKSYIIALYAINNFDGVKDINKLSTTIEFGKPHPKAETISFTF